MIALPQSSSIHLSSIAITRVFPFLLILLSRGNYRFMSKVSGEVEAMADNECMDNDDPSREDGPVDAKVARLIRSEVRVAVEEHVQNSMRGPPSYDSSAPLLNPSPTSNDIDPEAQQRGQTGSEEKLTWKVLARVFMGIFPVFLMMSSWVFLKSMEMDPLLISLLATVLIVVVFGAVILITLLVFVGNDTPVAKPTIPLSQEEEVESSWNFVRAVWYVLIVWLVICGTLWLWATITPDGVFHVWRVSHEFQLKIDICDALPKLVACLHESIPDRNATIVDFSTCLKAMGMNETILE